MSRAHADIQIPPKFWKSLTEEEFHEVCMTSELNAELSARAWRMCERQGPPPRKLGVMVSRADVMRLFPAPPRNKVEA